MCWWRSRRSIMDNESLITTNLINGPGRPSVLVVTFNTHALNSQVFKRLNVILDDIERYQGAPSGVKISGVIFTSSNPKIFLAGADLFYLNEIRDSILLLDAVIDIGHDTFERIHKLKIPTVAAINGACLGGGYELALACNYRICSNDRSTKVGLPEVNLGLIPAWGGCTRLPGLVGMPIALDAILTGKHYPAKLAKKKGLVDAVVHKEHLIDEAASVARGEKVYRRKLIPSFIPSRIAVRVARKKVLKKTKGNYPAPIEAIEALLYSTRTTRTHSYEKEKQIFIKLARTTDSFSVMDNLLRVFFLQEKSKKLKVSQVEAAPISRAAVLGAGTMGAGIAHWLSTRGVEVLLKDVKDDLVSSGLKKIGDLYVQGVLKHKMDRPAARDGLARISTSTNTVNLQNRDVVIEAIVEDLDIKKKVLADIENHVSDDCIIASNTSALSITEMASSLKRPERFVGIHFFNPVHQMKLVEVVRGEQTSDETVQRAVKFVQSISKLPVVVKDGPGFVVNRILIPYLLKAVDLTYDYPKEMIDQAMLQFGMPMGPFRLMDEIGLDVCSHVAWDICSRLKIDCENMVMLEKYIKAGHLGKKTGRGFYNYREKRKSTPITAKTSSAISMALVKVMTDEAVKIVEEGIIDDPEMLDLAMIMGTGWAPFRGGPLKFINYERETSN